MKAEYLERIFAFNGTMLKDPNPEMGVEAVQAHYANIYPDINTAVLKGPETIGNKQRYEWTRNVGTKG
jgi:PRTRC genetic system protein C